MKKYRVNVNGNVYDITLEVLEGEAAAASAGGETVKSPMPGTILSVNVKQGDAVKAGQVLMILEAMKMENEIMAPCDGTVSSVAVAQGASVDTGAVLCVIA